MIHRGEVYRASLPGLEGDKMVAVVSRDSVNRGMQPIVARVTANERDRGLPTAVELEPGEGGVRTTSFVLCHELWTVPQGRLDATPVGVLPLGKLIEIDKALRYALDVELG